MLITSNAFVLAQFDGENARQFITNSSTARVLVTLRISYSEKNRKPDKPNIPRGAHSRPMSNVGKV